MRLALAACLLVCLTPSASAQTTERYADVRLAAPDGDLGALVEAMAAAGLQLDHAAVEKDGGQRVLRTVLSQTELSRAQVAGATVRVLDADLSATVAARSGRGCPELDYPVTGSMGCFLTLDEVVANLDAMAAQYPDLVSVKQSIGQGHDGNDIWVVEISDQVGTDEGEPEVLYVGVHHAREAITPIAVLYWMWTLLDGYGSDASATFLVDNRRMFFVPVLNPDGYEFNRQTNPAGGGLWRKNRRDNGGGTMGVDLNRNYDYLWGLDNTGSSPDPSDQTYRGPAAFSEPETQALRDFLESGRAVRVALNYHSYSNLLLYPWGYAAETYTEDHDLFVPYAEQMTAENGYAPGTGPDILYPVNGVSDDWMYGEQTSKPKILSFTPEVGSPSDGFWPSPSRIEALAEETLPMSRLAALYAGGAPDVRDVAYLDDGANGFIDPGEGFSVQFTVCNVGLAPLEGAPLEARVVSLDPAAADALAYQLGPVYLTGAIGTRECFEAATFGMGVETGAQVGTYGQMGLEVTGDDGLAVRLPLADLVVGTPEVLLADDATTVENWVSDGSWGLGTVAASAPTAFTDSPDGDYPNSADLTFRLAEPLDFSDVTAATLTFNARWDVEDVYDWATVELSVGGGAWTALSGAHTTLGGGNGVQSEGGPGYDGVQDTFVAETMDLGAAAGADEVRIRFRLRSDGLVRGDGFIVDDVEVSKLVNGLIVSADRTPAARAFSLGAPRPNPSAGAVRLTATLPAGAATVAVYDVLGRRVATLLDGVVPAGARELRWDARDASGAPAAPGVYLVRADAGGERLSRRVLVTR